MGAAQFAIIIKRIEASPEGLTTQELIDQLSLPVIPQTLAARMGKMFAYGKIGRTQNMTAAGKKFTRWTKKD